MYVCMYVCIYMYIICMYVCMCLLTNIMEVEVYANVRSSISTNNYFNDVEDF